MPLGLVGSIGSGGGGLAAGASGLLFKGTWDANANTPALSDGSGTLGDYYIVSTPGATSLDGEIDWDIGDWAIAGGPTGEWVKIDNSDLWSKDALGNPFTLSNIGISGGSDASHNINIFSAGAKSFRMESIDLSASMLVSGETAAVLQVENNATGGTSSIDIKGDAGDSTGEHRLFIQDGVAPASPIGKLYNIGGVLTWGGASMSVGTIFINGIEFSASAELGLFQV